MDSTIKYARIYTTCLSPRTASKHRWSRRRCCSSSPEHRSFTRIRSSKPRCCSGVRRVNFGKTHRFVPPLSSSIFNRGNNKMPSKPQNQAERLYRYTRPAQPTEDSAPWAGNVMQPRAFLIIHNVVATHAMTSAIRATHTKIVSTSSLAFSCCILYFDVHGTSWHR